MWSERTVVKAKQRGGPGATLLYSHYLPKVGAQSWVTNTEDSHFVLPDVLTLTQFSGFVGI